jgi:hypothetical protein
VLSQAVCYISALPAFSRWQPEGKECNHIDGNKTNNILTNLALDSADFQPFSLLLFAAEEAARGDSIMRENKVPGRVESKARRLMHDLKKQGFEVSRGYFKLWRAEDCQYTFDRMGLCYGNNPAAPYVVFAVPRGRTNSWTRYHTRLCPAGHTTGT